MSEPLRCIPPNSVVLGWDFDVGSVNCAAYDLRGSILCRYRLPLDTHREGGVAEIGIAQIEGLTRATLRGVIARLRALNRDRDLVVGVIASGGFTSGRIDFQSNQIRRVILGADKTLAPFRELAIQRLGGPDKARELTGIPWSDRYSLAHLVKDEATLTPKQWNRTRWTLPHGSIAAGYLTDRFDCISLSSASATGMLDIRTNQWRKEMLAVLDDPIHRTRAWDSLPDLIDMHAPIGPIMEGLVAEVGLSPTARPLIFPTIESAGAEALACGIVDKGQVLITADESLSIDSISSALPAGGGLDVMRLNWGPCLLTSKLVNGVHFLRGLLGDALESPETEAAARLVAAGADGVEVLPFKSAEPALGIRSPRMLWLPANPENHAVRYRASLEAAAYLIAATIADHESVVGKIDRVCLAGTLAANELFTEILAAVLNRPVDRPREGDLATLGAGIAALTGLEARLRRDRGVRERFEVSDAAAFMTHMKPRIQPRADWAAAYRTGLRIFLDRIKS